MLTNIITVVLSDVIGPRDGRWRRAGGDGVARAAALARRQAGGRRPAAGIPLSHYNTSTQSHLPSGSGSLS